MPEAERRFRKKPELALEIVRHARESDLRYGWVGADAGYGKGPGFCAALDEMGETFFVDVHSDFQGYLEDPQPIYLKKPTVLDVNLQSIRAIKKALKLGTC